LTTASGLIPAAGRGERFGKGQSKVFIEVAGWPLIAYTLLAFQECPDISEIVLVVREDDLARAEDLRELAPKITAIVQGGTERTESVRRGLKHVRGELVAVHDGVRPLVTSELISRTVRAAAEHGAAVAAVPATDTIKEAGDDNFVLRTPDRSRLWLIQTPQTFRTDLLRWAYDAAARDRVTATDDAALVERIGEPVKLVMGSYDNIKVTRPEDVAFLEAKLGRSSSLGQAQPALHPAEGWEMRIGNGIDFHRISPDRRLVLGGVHFPGEPGLDGHSDADIILHAISDALLGAACLGDIGQHFPDTDPRFKDADSLKLLEEVGRLVAAAGWTAVNIDATLLGEHPRIAPKTREMAENVARALGIDPSHVSIKGTTTEGMGAIGATIRRASQARG